MQMPQPLYHSADMVRGLVDESRHWPRDEAVHGELLVTPAPRPTHQRVAFHLARRSAEYLDGTPVGAVFMSPADVLVQRGVFVVPIENARVST